MTATATTTTTATTPQGQRVVAAPAHTKPPVAVLGRLHDVWALTRRNLVHISREPTQLSDVTVQPVLFTVLFIFIFGGGIPIPGGGSYKDFALAGLLALNLVTSTMGTAVGLSTDLHEGIVERFRTLPMWRCRGAGGALGCRLDDLGAVRFHRGADRARRRVAAGRQLRFGARRFRPGAVLRLLVVVDRGLRRSEQQESRIGRLIWIHSALPAGVRLQRDGAHPAHARLASSHRRLEPGQRSYLGDPRAWGNPNPSGRIQVWPMQHPVEAALIWSVLILAVAAPMASHFFQRRTTE